MSEKKRVVLAGSRKADRRIERTRRGLLSAFATLVLQRGYEQTKVADIAAHANVGRSTFYEHFESKDDILAQSLSIIFGALADTVSDAHDAERLQRIIEHFWENRKLGSTMLFGPTRPLAMRMLSTLIESRLAGRARRTRPKLPLQLVADHLAGAQLALIESWFDGRIPCASEEVARALYDSARSSTSALIGE